jgi:MFS family permease
MTRTPLDAGQRSLAVGLVLSVTLVAFETTAVITALPTITDVLHGDSLYGATLAAYMLADLVALVWAGEQADLHGVRRPFLVCIAMFVIGLIVAATAQTMVMVLVGRLLQGAGSGGFAPLSYIAVRRAFPQERQATMYAYLSAGWVVPSLLGPVVAGIVVDKAGWRWVFIGIIPFAVVVALLTARAMAHLNPSDAVINRRPSRLGHAFQAAAGVGILAAGLQNRIVPLAVSLSIAGLAIAIPALRYMLPPGVFRARRGLSAIVAVRFLATATFLGVDSFVPLAADRLHGSRPIVQGFVIAGAAITWTIGQAVTARRGDRVKPGPSAGLGFGFMLIGIATVAPVLAPSWPLPLTFVAWSIGGFGMGILFNPTTVASMSYADDGREGEISSQIHLADSLGFGVMGAVGGATVAFADHTSLTLKGAIGVNFGLAAMCALLGVLASRGVRSRT